MDLRQLQQFVVLAETLSFRSTAERLFMTTPPLSVSIRKLEEEIGAKLFTRSTHIVELTPAGRNALEQARKTLFHAGEFARVARATSLGLDEQLRIGFVGSARYKLLPRVLPHFKLQHPDITLKLHQNSNTWILNALEAGEIDLGIVIGGAPRARDDGRFRYEVVECDRLSVALPADHPLAARSSLTLHDIAQEPFIRYTENSAPGMHALTMRAFEAAGIAPRVVHETLQIQTVVMLVETTLGVALVPSAAAINASTKVVFRPLEPKSEVTTVRMELVFDPTRLTDASRLFRDMALAGLEAQEDRLSTHVV